MDNPRAWTIFVALWMLFGGAGQLAYSIIKGEWRRDRLEYNSCFFWLGTAGSVGGIVFGILLIALTLW